MSMESPLEFLHQAREGEVLVAIYNWVEWRSIVKHNRSPTGQSRNKPMPHHPSYCCILKKHRSLPHTGVKLVLLLVLYEGSNCSMAYAFRLSHGQMDTNIEKVTIEHSLPVVPDEKRTKTG